MGRESSFKKILEKAKPVDNTNSKVGTVKITGKIHSSEKGKFVIMTRDDTIERSLLEINAEDVKTHEVLGDESEMILSVYVKPDAQIKKIVQDSINNVIIKKPSTWTNPTVPLPGIPGNNPDLLGRFKPVGEDMDNEDKIGALISQCDNARRLAMDRRFVANALLQSGLISQTTHGDYMGAIRTAEDSCDVNTLRNLFN